MKRAGKQVGQNFGRPGVVSAQPHARDQFPLPLHALPRMVDGPFDMCQFVSVRDGFTLGGSLMAASRAFEHLDNMAMAYVVPVYADQPATGAAALAPRPGRQGPGVCRPQRLCRKGHDLYRRS